ncbi:hypothetical protein QFZ63_004190 [Streptomyces sp. B3I7]|nr:hypothetical protein [Streptomyces sp. B3I7]
MVCTVIGTVTTVALRSHLYDQLDGQLQEIAARASGAFPPPEGLKNGTAPGGQSAGRQNGDGQSAGRQNGDGQSAGRQNGDGRQARGTDLTDFVTRGPQPPGTIAATLTDGTVTEAEVGDKARDDNNIPQMEVGSLSAAQREALATVARDGDEHSVEIPGARRQSETRVRRSFADAGHELRTPLASLRGHAELTRRGREQVGPDTRHALGRIESEAGRMTLLGGPAAARPAGRRTAAAVRTDRPGPAGRGHRQRRPRRRPRPRPAPSAARRTGAGLRRRRPAATGPGQPAGQRPHPHPARHHRHRARRAARVGRFADGRIHCFIAGGGMGGDSGTSSKISSWVESNFKKVTVGSATFYDFTRPTGGSDNG